MRCKTVEEFVTDSKRVHGDKYDYSRVVYKNNSSKIEIGCPLHGYYFAVAKRHSQHEQGCPVCGLGALNYKKHSLSTRKTHDQFLVEARGIHGDKYDYQMCVYEGGKRKMPIICPEHGVFYQHAEGHINSRQGCAKCYHEGRKGKPSAGGYCATFFETYPEKKSLPAIIYAARMHHKNDTFIKIGITSKGSVRKRFYHHAKDCTVITPLVEVPGTLHEVFLREEQLLSLLKDFRFYPNRRFGGYTECFKINEHTLAILSDYFGINIRNVMDRL